MKKLFVLAMLIGLLSSCKKEEMVSPSESTAQVETEIAKPIASQTKAAMTGYAVSPRFGKPNSTYYTFKVLDAGGTLGVSVKLYDRATSTITYLPMGKTGNYWLLSTKLPNNSCFAYNYVYSISKNVVTTTNTPSYPDLWNSRNVFTSSPYAISWPFGADGSSWNNRFDWKGGEETKSASNIYGSHVGFGWNEGTHQNTDEKYSDDWNRGTNANDDLGAIIRSPLDGYIETISSYYVSGFGYSKYVSIIQQGSDGKLYRFYVAHLQSTASSLYQGKYVRAGIDQIGTLGMSGASSPHAHSNMRVNGISVPFYFNAQ